MNPCFNLRSRTLMLAMMMATLFLAVPASHAQEGAALRIVQKAGPAPADANKGNLTFTMEGAQFTIENRDPQQELLGATFAPLGKALRAQLNVPVGQGIIVESLRADGPSAHAGLKVYDVLLTLGDKPITSAEDLSKHLKAAGEAPVTLKLLRAGKPMALQVRPVYRVTLGPAHQDREEYFLGVSLGNLEEAVRSQLGIPSGQGMVITEVQKNSPADKAGIQALDIILDYAGKAIGTGEKLAAQVQAGQDKPQVLKLIRSGKPLTISVTAGLRKVEGIEATMLFGPSIIVLKPEPGKGPDKTFQLHFDGAQLKLTEPNLTPAQRIEQLEKENHTLRQLIEKMKSSPPPMK